MKPKYLIYANGSLENHGCEAILRTTLNILKLNSQNTIITTNNLKNSKKYINDLKLNLIEFDYFGTRSIALRIINKISRCIFANNIFSAKYKYDKLVDVFSKVDIALSVGGDNYCYKNTKWLIKQNEIGRHQGTKLILWGASIDRNIINQPETFDDLMKFDLIIVRESISNKLLLDVGVNKEKLKLLPDPAFVLEKKKVTLSKLFQNRNVIGINISPLIISYEHTKKSILKNYIQLIEYIINYTDSNIALIPHVVTKNGDDRKPINYIYNLFKNTGRAEIIDDHNCMELKYIISKCRMFIGARTHSVIAAYSTCVPTIVLGYSVKAKGIAKDIFGEYENYVIPVQSLQNEDDLTKAYQWLSNHEEEIRTHLKKFMPSYINKAWQAGDEVKMLIGE